MIQTQIILNALATEMAYFCDTSTHVNSVSYGFTGQELTGRALLPENPLGPCVNAWRTGFSPVEGTSFSYRTHNRDKEGAMRSHGNRTTPGDTLE